MAVLENIERYLLNGPVTDVLAGFGTTRGSTQELNLKIEVERAYIQGVEFGEDQAFLRFLDDRTLNRRADKTLAQAELLGIASDTEKRKCDTMRKIRSRVERKESHIPEVYREHLFGTFFRDIEMPNRVAEWANGMAAAVQFLHEAFDRRTDPLLPKLDPLWFAAAYLALSTKKWFQPIQGGSLDDAFRLGLRHVQNAAIALETNVKANLTHGALLYRMCEMYGKAMALALHFLHDRRGG